MLHTTCIAVLDYASWTGLTREMRHEAYEAVLKHISYIPYEHVQSIVLLNKALDPYALAAFE